MRMRRANLSRFASSKKTNKKFHSVLIEMKFLGDLLLRFVFVQYYKTVCQSFYYMY